MTPSSPNVADDPTYRDDPEGFVVGGHDTVIALTANDTQVADDDHGPTHPVDPFDVDDQDHLVDRGPFLFDPTLALAADVLDDLESVRKANRNRLLMLTRTEADADGVYRGLGLDESHPDVARLATIVDAIAGVEDDAVKHLERVVRRHPLHPWIKTRRGLGDKQFARLLAAVGDPYWNTLHGRPRRVSELWAYCGMHVLPAGDQHGTDSHLSSVVGENQIVVDLQVNLGDQLTHEVDQTGAGGGDHDQPTDEIPRVCVGVAPARRRGQRANWSQVARMRLWNVSNSVLKAGGPYRAFYDAAREKYADAVHAVPCVRCGPRGHPALAGSPLSKAHQHGRGLRAIGKAVLKDLWIEARRLHHLHYGDEVPVEN